MKIGLGLSRLKLQLESLAEATKKKPAPPPTGELSLDFSDAENSAYVALLPVWR